MTPIAMLKHPSRLECIGNAMARHARQLSSAGSALGDAHQSTTV